MLKHNLLVMLRNITRSKGYFLINLVGLTAGLVCTLLIFLWVNDELNIDRFHEKETRLFQVMEHQQYADEIMTTISTPGILAETLKEEVPEVEFAATTTWINPYTLSLDEKNQKAEGYHVGQDFFELFSFPLVEGQPAEVLKDKYAIVISRQLAESFFGSPAEAIGKQLEFQHEKTFQVTGVFEKVAASSFQFDFVLNFEEFKTENEWVMQWGNNGPSTYIVLHEGSDAAAVEEKIKDFIKARNEGSHVTLFLKPFAERYLYGRYINGKPAGGRIEYVQLFSAIAIFILLIACINFMNLSTARASKKAKEVGIRKSIGAQRRSLVLYYITESVAICLFALLLAVAIVWLVLPQFNAITDKKIYIELSYILFFIPVAVVTGLVSGSYPALFLSGFRPAKVLKGEPKGSWAELWARKGLVVFQFFLSVVLIVAVLVIYNQIQFVQSKNLGYKKDNLIRFSVEGKIETTLETFLTELRRIPGVEQAGAVGHSLAGRNNNTMGLQWEGKNPEDNILFENVRVSHGLLETMGFELIEGRFFLPSNPADTSKIIFNEAAIRVMNLEDPIGKVIKLWDQYDLEIVGVVKDFHFQSLHDQVNPLFFILNPRNTWNIMARIEGGKEKETLEAIRNFYQEYNPGFTFDYRFQDEVYGRMYANEQRVATLSFYFAGFAIIISCLGLFGLATFTAERRLKEIGIRKTMGSSVTNIVLLLSKDFTVLVIVAIVIGVPVSYYLLSTWLTRFAFHIELSVYYFLAAGCMALLIAWVTVASQALRAARVNPVQCLRTE